MVDPRFVQKITPTKGATKRQQKGKKKDRKKAQSLSSSRARNQQAWGLGRLAVARKKMADV
jgi:hypothetical protein